MFIISYQACIILCTWWRLFIYEYLNLNRIAGIFKYWFIIFVSALKGTVAPRLSIWIFTDRALQTFSFYKSSPFGKICEVNPTARQSRKLWKQFFSCSFFVLSIKKELIKGFQFHITSVWTSVWESVKIWKLSNSFHN